MNKEKGFVYKILTVPFSSCVTICKLTNFSERQHPHLRKGKYNKWVVVL